MTTKLFNGINAALYTAYREDGAVDCDETGRLARWLVEKGIAGLYLCGTTGDGLLLSLDERRRIVATVAGAVGANVPLMVHVGTLATRDAVDLARHAADQQGVCAISSLGPVYYPLPLADQVNHLSRIAEATELPFYPYLFHDSVQSHGIPAILAAFREIPRLGGIKAFVPDLSVHQTILAQGEPSWELLHGHDPTLAQALAIPGVDGAIGSTYNVVPEIVVAVHAAARRGDHGTAAQLHQRYGHYWRPAVRLGSPLTIGRHWLNQRGFRMGEPRLPKRCAPQAMIDEMAQGLQRGGFDVLKGGM